VAAQAKVGKATIYRRWPSKEELAEALLEDLATPAVAVPAANDTRTELFEIVMNTATGRLQNFRVDKRRFQAYD
jgi:AcrR family transcriptional regulator